MGPLTRAHAIIDRLGALLEECHGLRLDLEALEGLDEREQVEVERILYATLLSAVETGLIRTMEDVLSVLRQASAPLGPMGAEWLARQERALNRDDS